MTATLTMSYSTGSTMWANLQIALPSDIDVRGAFGEISDMVEKALRSKIDAWHSQHFTIELSIVVLCPRESDESEANLVSCAVCDALGIIPRADMRWNGKSPWKSRQ